jgi:hypothetical protein
MQFIHGYLLIVSEQKYLKIRAGCSGRELRVLLNQIFFGVSMMESYSQNGWTLHLIEILEKEMFNFIGVCSSPKPAGLL